MKAAKAMRPSGGSAPSSLKSTTVTPLHGGRAPKAMKIPMKAMKSPTKFNAMKSHVEAMKSPMKLKAMKSPMKAMSKVPMKAMKPKLAMSRGGGAPKVKPAAAAPTVPAAAYVPLISPEHNRGPPRRHGSPSVPKCLIIYPPAAYRPFGIGTPSPEVWQAVPGTVLAHVIDLALTAIMNNDDTENWEWDCKTDQGVMRFELSPTTRGYVLEACGEHP